MADRVERDNSDVGVGERLGGVGDLSQHLASVVAAKHGQLVHSPVPADIVCVMMRTAGQIAARYRQAPVKILPVVHVVGVHCSTDVVGVHGLDVCTLWL